MKFDNCLKIRFSNTFDTLDHGLLNTRPHMFIFSRPKLRSQFSENLVLRVYEFPSNSGDKISKAKKLWKFWELKI